MRPLGASTPGVADEHVEVAEPLDRQADDGLDVGELAHVGAQRLDLAARLGQPGDGGVERCRR